MITAMACAPEEELSDLWLQLCAEQRAILRFVYRHGNSVLTYSLIADNMEIPRLPGDDRSEIISDRTLAKHAKTLEAPPLELIRRAGERSGIQLSAKGARLMRLIAREKLQ